MRTYHCERDLLGGSDSRNSGVGTRTEWWAKRPQRRAYGYDLQTIETVARGYLNTMQEKKKKKLKKDGVLTIVDRAGQVASL